MRREAWGAAAGLLTGLGLAVSGLTSPEKVLDFLDVTGRWDPSPLLTIAAALAVSLPFIAWQSRRGPRSSSTPVPPAPRDRSRWRLLTGSAVLGVGCGIAGYVPATAIANLAYSTSEAVLFVIALLVGSQLARFSERR